jgi:hypothetical protein
MVGSVGYLLYSFAFIKGTKLLNGGRRGWREPKEQPHLHDLEGFLVRRL